ncbi:MAG: hypothetical protein UY48_C0002G0058 [Candidatus Gottesmanbacteria bacterium GW2011_GWB1_49_7]|uniref:Uncharacterized protein n=1 Tax=Candidatus Gottesmanbacteria bacterium GW2011_GWB1_49_7 TaxID=1618448 RepID=A0A0G1YEG4_9BACT|nr:MAG: hypothetical protein UY48_C0002G0058 [Candidatus Gottesmanbacteria bacterium GW2011_GWB1_49_7]
MKRPYFFQQAGTEVATGVGVICFDQQGFGPILADNLVALLRDRAECARWEFVEAPVPDLPDSGDPTDPSDWTNPTDLRSPEPEPEPELPPVGLTATEPAPKPRRTRKR